MKGFLSRGDRLLTRLFSFVSLHRKEVLLVSALFYVVMFFTFYPSYMTIADETEYLRATYQLSEGRILVDDVFDSYRYYHRDGHFIPKYPLGNSILLLPFASIDWTWIFLSGLILHLLNFYLMILILDRYRLDRLFSLLYLFYPGYIFYSRTIMSEVPTLTLTLLGFYFFLRKDEKRLHFGTRNRALFLSGLFLGLSCFIRPTNALVIVGLFLPTFFKFIFDILTWMRISSFEVHVLWKKVMDRRHVFMYFPLGVLPGFLIVVYFNSLIYGDPFTVGFGGGSGNSAYSFLLSVPTSVLLVYSKPLLIMLFMYPLMAVVPFFTRFKHRFEILTIFILFFVVLGKSNVVRYGLLTNLAVGHRYFFTILPLLFIPYALFLKQYFKRIWLFGIFALFIAVPILMIQQGGYVDTNFSVSNDIYQTVPQGSVVVAPWGTLQLMNNYLDDSFESNFKVMDPQNFARSGYSGEYYHVYYLNAALWNNIRKQSDVALKGSEYSGFLEFKKQHDVVLERDGLVIVHVVPEKKDEGDSLVS